MLEGSCFLSCSSLTSILRPPASNLPMTTAIYYTSIRPEQGRENHVYGLNVAIGDWTRAYFRYARAEKFTFLIGHQWELEDIEQMAAEAGVDKARLVTLDRRYPAQNFGGFTHVFRPEPGTRNMFWLRQSFGAFSFCGLAHAISGVEAGEVLQEYCLTPSEASDAIICPSWAVQSAIRAFFDNYGDYIAEQFGAVYKCPVQLPVIPLGIDIEKFAAKNTPEKRALQRAALGIGDNDIVLLWVGRLSYAIKAHPLAMYQTAEQVAAKTSVKVHLVMVGYFVPAESAGEFKNLARDVCRKANVVFVDAKDTRFPDGLWAAGDIFLSLIDNCQESFGLTPVEAMAAGIPRVISDWNGYRDAVVDGEDGFLIRTMQPPAGNGFDLTVMAASGREIYGGLLARAAATVMVDVDQAVERILLLVNDKNLRTRMIEKARARVRAIYDWRHIIPAYENLWAEQVARRKANPPPKKQWKTALPQLPDSYAMYEAYPTRSLTLNDKIILAASSDEIRVLWAHAMNTYAHDMLVSANDVTALIGWLGQKNVTIQAVFDHFPALDRPSLWRTIGWLLKLGIVKIDLDK